MAGHSLGSPAGDGLGGHIGFEEQLLVPWAAVATEMGWCAIVHPKCILSPQQGVSRSWGAWCMAAHLKHYGWRFYFSSCGAQLNVSICATKDMSVFLLRAKKGIL